METIKEMVLRQLNATPNILLKDCQMVVPGLKKDNFYKIKRERNKPKVNSKLKNAKVDSTLEQKNSRSSSSRAKGRKAPDPDKNYKHINLTTIHDLLVRCVNGENINLTAVKYCIDYYKGFKEDIKQDEIDVNLEDLLDIGKSIERMRIVEQAAED